MCLFFGDLLPDCGHSECQIIATIRALNQQSLFSQIAAQQFRDDNEGQPKENPEEEVSLDNYVEEDSPRPVFKEEDVEDGKMEQFCDFEDRPKEEETMYQRLVRLEYEVSSLREVTMQMKAQLERKGLLQI